MKAFFKSPLFSLAAIVFFYMQLTDKINRWGYFPTVAHTPFEHGYNAGYICGYAISILLMVSIIMQHSYKLVKPVLIKK